MVVLTITACKSVTKEPVTVETDTKEKEMAPEWVSLFDGTSLSGWHVYNNPEGTNPWTIEDGVLMFPGRAAGSKPEFNLVTDNEYTDFILSLEWKISEAGNSGIFWGVHEDEKFSEAYMTGPEIQVLDNEKHPDSFVGNGIHKAGSLYDLIGYPDEYINPAGKWNKCELEIDHKKNIGTVTMNGKASISFPLSGEKWNTMVANSKFKDWEGFGRYPTGHIGLQDHSDKVWYKNIKIKEI